jgi:hypothetical protein
MVSFFHGDLFANIIMFTAFSPLSSRVYPLPLHPIPIDSLFSPLPFFLHLILTSSAIHRHNGELHCQTRPQTLPLCSSSHLPKIHCFSFFLSHRNLFFFGHSAQIFLFILVRMGLKT